MPLSFGSRSDWVRNVLAAGGCEVRLDGRDYIATNPRLVRLSDAMPVLRTVYTPGQQRGIKVVGIQQVLYLDANEAPSGAEPGRNR